MIPPAAGTEKDDPGDSLDLGRLADDLPHHRILIGFDDAVVDDTVRSLQRIRVRFCLHAGTSAL